MCISFEKTIWGRSHLAEGTICALWARNALGCPKISCSVAVGTISIQRKIIKETISGVFCLILSLKVNSV